jgi:hypothetical protein
MKNAHTWTPRSTLSYGSLITEQTIAIQTSKKWSGAALLIDGGGARTLAQDEESGVVFGMRKEAIKRGGAARGVALEGVAAEIQAFGA